MSEKLSAFGVTRRTNKRFSADLRQTFGAARRIIQAAANQQLLAM
ncbi:hypothetical protein [Steroidobacter gossypii]|nr:hypothetical protein [Steroidobacter gossypii]